MRIRFLMQNVYRPGGGVLTVVRHLAAELAKRHDVEVVSVHRTADEPIHPMPAGVASRVLVDKRDGSPDRTRHAPELGRRSRVIPATDPFYGSYSEYSDLKLEEYLSSLRGGAVIGVEPGAIVAIATLAPGAVLRVGQEHKPIGLRSEATLATMAAIASGLDLFVTLTEADALAYGRILRGAVQVCAMPNGIPPYNGELARLDQPVVTAAGALIRNKGFDRLIDAWRLVHETHPEWQLRIYGKGALGSRLRKRIDDLDLAGSVRLMGYSTALREDLAASSMFVLSSRAEGYGMVLVEAMSCGVPVVSFDSPSGPRSIITDGKDGLLVPNGDVTGLAAAINQMIELGVSGRRRFGAAGLQKAGALSQSAIAARWETLLASELDRKHPAARGPGSPDRE